MRWANLGWRVYALLVLALVFAHEVNGWRKVMHDHVPEEQNLRIISWWWFGFWLVFSVIGAVRLIGRVRQP